MQSSKDPFRSAHPDYYIYLRDTPENCFARCKKRGRIEEANYTQSYFDLIHRFHELWFSNLAEEEWGNVLVLDVGIGDRDLEKNVQAAKEPTMNILRDRLSALAVSPQRIKFDDLALNRAYPIRSLEVFDSKFGDCISASITVDGVLKKIYLPKRFADMKEFIGEINSEIGMGKKWKLIWEGAADQSHNVSMDVQKLVPTAVLPTRAYLQAAGYDLYSCEDVVLEPAKPTKVPTNIAIALPVNTFGLILGRSSHACAGINVHIGLIDPDYRAGISVVLTNVGYRSKKIRGFSKIAQLVVIPFVAPRDIEGGQWIRIVRSATFPAHIVIKISNTKARSTAILKNTIRQTGQQQHIHAQFAHAHTRLDGGYNDI
ncbi:hypothetical protein FOCC_FOCC015683 [Frankliniella occidentalis]|nr:hypothetical protein FOCC_FOCC015683 [Frankliniella occidentalis]